MNLIFRIIRILSATLFINGVIVSNLVYLDIKSILFIPILNAQNYSFPKTFIFGVGTSAYQIEGAWNISGKGENIWDHYVHTQPNKIANHATADIACDAYHKTKEDVQLIKNLGVNFYRFSISWSRILPSGFINKINADGIRYYNELIDELIAHDIVPYVTMYHWDLPQPLQEVGGWPNRLLADYFVQYARVLFKIFGDRVKHWITFNEPMQVCEASYGLGLLAPGYNSDGIAPYMCSTTLLIAHGKTYRMYNREFRMKQRGKVGISIDSSWFEPGTNSTEDIDAAERAMQMNYGWYVNPIISKTGDYPKIMRKRINRLSKEEGFPTTRLPYFTREEISMIRGSFDFLGLNHYTSRMAINNASSVYVQPSFAADMDVTTYQLSDWEPSASAWLKVVPWGFRKLLNWIKKEYNNPEIIITENGFADPDTPNLEDCRSVHYYNSYLGQLLLAMYEDGCNVVGYTAWSYMDNFEWTYGYTSKFGLYYVDFDNPTRPRTPKLSALNFANIIKTRKIDWEYTPNNFSRCEW